MIYNFLFVIYVALFIYLSCSAIYLFVLSLASRFFYKKEFSLDLASTTWKKIAILVPAYKEDGVILSTATNILQSDYPSDCFDVYIIADSFQTDTIVNLSATKAIVMKVQFDKSTKTKALNEAFRRIDKTYDIALVCDADNMLRKDFLKKINNAFLNGWRAVQGRRVAKNLDSPYAILDACSEGINNNMFRKGQNALGLSACVIGSGMAFEYDFIKSIFQKMNAVGGFDKILQLDITAKNIFIRYLDDAFIFDEKVNSSAAFQQQRKRWISTQFIYLKKYFIPAFKRLLQGNVSYFILAVVNNIVLPRAFLLLLFPLFSVLSFFINIYWGLASVVLLLIYGAALFIAVPPELISKSLLRSILQLPRAIFIMLGTIFHLRKANKSFIHTVHTQTEVRNSLYDDIKN